MNFAARGMKSSMYYRRVDNCFQAITASKLEPARVKPTNKGQQECLKKAEAHLDEGKKALGTRQKHIMVAEQSDYSWATVQQYDINPLATDSEDKKKLEKVEKEAERLANKSR